VELAFGTNVKGQTKTGTLPCFEDEVLDEDDDMKTPNTAEGSFHE
jgi:hypothetical protein